MPPKFAEAVTQQFAARSTLSDSGSVDTVGQRQRNQGGHSDPSSVRGACGEAGDFDWLSLPLFDPGVLPSLMIQDDPGPND